jgi:hypothetical protein
MSDAKLEHIILDNPFAGNRGISSHYWPRKQTLHAMACGNFLFSGRVMTRGLPDIHAFILNPCPCQNRVRSWSSLRMHMCP